MRWLNWEFVGFTVIGSTNELSAGSKFSGFVVAPSAPSPDEFPPPPPPPEEHPARSIDPPATPAIPVQGTCRRGMNL